MAKVSFTAARVNGHTCPADKSQAFLWDSKATGLGLRVTAAGAKAYIFQGKIHGKTVRVTIGDPRNWGIDDAQEEARRLQRLVDKGIDPRERRAEEQASHAARQAERLRQDTTVKDAWDEYVQYLRTKTASKSKRPRSERYINEHISYTSHGGEPKKRGKGKTVPGPLWPLMTLNLGELTGRRVAEWLDDEGGQRPTAAAYAYRMVRAFVRWCEGKEKYQGIIPADVYSAKDVTDAVPRVGHRSDRLERGQLAAWFGAVRQLPPVASTYLQGLLLNGPRRGELEALQWEHVDFRWGSLHLKDKVEAQGRTIPLTPYFASLLRELRRINETPPNIRRLKTLTDRGEAWEPSKWVFPSPTSESGHITEARTAHARALDAAGLPHVTVHGLRRSFTSLAKARWLDAPAGVVAQIQGHKPSAIQERHYTNRTLDELREWHNRIEAWMIEQAEIKFDADASKKGPQEAVDAA